MVYIDASCLQYKEYTTLIDLNVLFASGHTLKLFKLGLYLLRGHNEVLVDVS